MVMEFWVMRVLLHPGPMRKPVTFSNVAAKEYLNVMAHVERGSMACLPDGCIAEPVEVFTGDGAQLAADAHRAKLAADDNSGDYRVILNSDMSV